MTVPHMPIPFKEAAAYRITFGQFSGRTVDEIASTDRGLAYLDWMRGHLRLDFHTENAVCSYLDDATIAKDLAALIETKGGRS